MNEKQHFECDELHLAYEKARDSVHSHDAIDGYSIAELDTVTAIGTIIAALDAGIVLSQSLEPCFFEALYMLEQLRDDRCAKGKQ